MTIEGPRLLGKSIDGLSVVYNAGPTVAVETLEGSDWKELDRVTFVNRGYYDLSGYRLKDLSLFFSTVDVQEGWGPTGDMTAFSIVDLITTEFVPDDQVQLSLESTGGVPLAPVGFLRSTFNMEQVVYGRTRKYVMSTTGTFASQPQLSSATSWGSCLATAGDKLHITRYVITATPSPGLRFDIPPAHYLTAGIVAEEPTLEYLMRMKRSYEHANAQ